MKKLPEQLRPGQLKTILNSFITRLEEALITTPQPNPFEVKTSYGELRTYEGVFSIKINEHNYTEKTSIITLTFPQPVSGMFTTTPSINVDDGTNEIKTLHSLNNVKSVKFIVYSDEFIMIRSERSFPIMIDLPIAATRVIGNGVVIHKNGNEQIIDGDTLLNTNPGAKVSAAYFGIISPRIYCGKYEYVQ